MTNEELKKKYLLGRNRTRGWTNYQSCGKTCPRTRSKAGRPHRENFEGRNRRAATRLKDLRFIVGPMANDGVAAARLEGPRTHATGVLSNKRKRLQLFKQLFCAGHQPAD